MDDIHIGLSPAAFYEVNMKRIICIGDLCADLIIPYGEYKAYISALKEGDIKSRDVELRSGGTVGNTCRVLGRLGSKPYFITDLCEDSLGRFLRGEMEKDGVDMSLSPVGSYGAMVCIAVLDEGGDRTMFAWVPPGSRYPTFSEESFSEELYKEDALIFTGGMTLNNDPDSMEAVLRFIKRMKKETNSEFIFDLNARIESYGLNEVRKHYYDEFIALSDIVLGSGIEEFGPISGKTTLMEAGRYLASFKASDEYGCRKGPMEAPCEFVGMTSDEANIKNNMTDAVKHSSSHRGRTVILRDGAEAVLIISRKSDEGAAEGAIQEKMPSGSDRNFSGEDMERGESFIIETVPVEPVKVVSTVGAGDSFDAAFIHAYNRGLPIRSCVAFSNKVAGHVISHEGQLDVGDIRL